MAPTTSRFVSRHSAAKVVGYSSSPGDKHLKSVPGHCLNPRPGHISATGTASSHNYNARGAHASHKAFAALPDPLSATAATTLTETAVDTSLDTETVRLVTAATILSHSDSGSDTDTAEAFSSLDEDSGVLTDPLAYLDELTTLDADSLALAIGILRQHQPLDADEADVQLSERLLDLLVLLHHRPASMSSSRTSSRSASPAFGSSASTASGLSDADEDGFWSGGDEWSDVRSALMSIGINASVDESYDEDVWTLEEEGLARRTRLLKSLPRLTPDTAQMLTDFLASLQQQRTDTASSTVADGSRDMLAAGGNGRTAVADQQLSEEDKLWWEQVTEAYQLLWRQARLQQAK